MRYLAAYLLASLGGAAPSAAAIKKILEAGGVDVDDDRVDEVVKALDGKTISEVIEAGRAKLGSVPSGGAVAAAPAAGGAAAAADAAPAVAEEPAKEEKKDDSDEESDDDMGFGLFD